MGFNGTNSRSKKTKPRMGRRQGGCGCRGRGLILYIELTKRSTANPRHKNSPYFVIQTK